MALAGKKCHCWVSAHFRFSSPLSSERVLQKGSSVGSTKERCFLGRNFLVSGENSALLSHQVLFVRPQRAPSVGAMLGSDCHWEHHTTPSSRHGQRLEKDRKTIQHTFLVVQHPNPVESFLSPTTRIPTEQPRQRTPGACETSVVTGGSCFLSPCMKYLAGGPN